MKRVNVYLKLRVLGAIDSMAGNSIKSRIREVSKLTFHDEDGSPHVFEGILRRTRNLCISAMLEAVRDRKQVIGIEQVNNVLRQPHWRKDHDLETI